MNLGDHFIIRATDRIIRAEHYYHLPKDATDQEIEIINKECDILLLKGGNFIYGGWPGKNLPYEVLRKVRIPMTYLGGGIQDSKNLSITMNLTQEDQDVLRLIHDRSVSCMVRGHRTAEFLHTLGITNTRVLGCPSLFWSLKPALSVKKVSFENTGWSFRQTLFSTDAQVHRDQFTHLMDLRAFSENMTVFTQGEEIELQSLLMFRQWGCTHYFTEEKIQGTRVRKTHRTPVCEETLWKAVLQKYGKNIDEASLRWIAEHVFFSYDLDEFERAVAGLTFMAGCRFHGNMLAISHGVPTLFYVYDERTRELADLLKVPNRTMSERMTKEQLLGLDFQPFERNYEMLFSQLGSFLDENKISHNLESPKPSAFCSER